MQEYIISIDPGREKSGIALLDMSGSVVEMTVLPDAEIPSFLATLKDKYHIRLAALGNGTGFQAISEKIKKMGWEIIIVDEKGSTLEGRNLAWKENPPPWFIRILPRIFWLTPRNLDAWAAVAIAKRALQSLKNQI